jgi:hypothetical protein
MKNLHVFANSYLVLIWFEYKIKSNLHSKPDHESTPGQSSSAFVNTSQGETDNTEVPHIGHFFAEYNLMKCWLKVVDLQNCLNRVQELAYKWAVRVVSLVRAQ